MRVTKVYDERTGDPFRDNNARRANRELHRATWGYLKIQAKSRRRRAAIMRAEFPRYAGIVAVAAESLAQREGRR